jgi:uncharacterized coiled-coil DUF342 family protein
MQLLNPRQLRSITEVEKALETKDLYERRDRILEEIKKFNNQRDILIKSKYLLEEEYNKFCLEINDKRKGMLQEIKDLEEKKQSLTNFIVKSKQEIQNYEAFN